MRMRQIPSVVSWRVQLTFSPLQVHQLLGSEEGRARIWNDAALEGDGALIALLADGSTWDAVDLDADPPYCLSVDYGQGTTTCSLDDDGSGGTYFTLTDVGAPGEDRTAVIAVWVSALSALKAAADFSDALHAHDHLHAWPWAYGYSAEH